MGSLKRTWTKGVLIGGGLVAMIMAVSLVYAAVEAPAGYDNQTNEFESPGEMTSDMATFAGQEQINNGLGPVYNAQSCGECHQNPVTGSGSQVTELRAASFDGFTYADHPGGSLINDRAINPAIQERALSSDNVTTFRASLNTLGDGFVEAIPDSEFIRVQNAQPAGMKGQIINVPVLEGPPGTTRIARFGWKNQHASLLSFSADAYLNEMGITNPLLPTENTSNGNSVAAYDTVLDPEDPATTAHPFGEDVEAFARFMRSTKVPPRDTAVINNADVVAGGNLFTSVGCSICHTPTFTTAPAGTVFNGGKFVVPAALGDKIIHPYSDFMLHDVGTGDGIIQNGGSSTRTKLRTPPLWGLRTRSRLMHDTLDLTRNNAILAHTNEAEPVIQNYINLSTTQKNQLIAFINSL
jgi:CxxC motif-containing protein (DUF1111 family)